jgi:hypothetical protein
MLVNTNQSSELQEAFDELYTGLEGANLALVLAEELLESPRVTRLANRRKLNAVIPGVQPQLRLFDWLLSEALDQWELVTGELLELLEAPRSGQTRYGLKTGIFPRTPVDWAKCGTAANYHQHRRRGQDCPRCRKAAVHANAERRARKVLRNNDSERQEEHACVL